MLAVIVAVPQVYSQAPSNALSKMESASEITRMAGFEEIVQLANTGAPPEIGLRPRVERLAKYAHEHAEVAVGLINLLERESAALRGGAGRGLGESYSVDYYGNLIGSVAALHDVRATRALLDVIETGEMATQGLAALGEAAGPGVLLAAHSNKSFRRLQAIVTLGEMMAVSPNTRLTERMRGDIRATLLATLKDADASFRMVALRGLSYFADADVRIAVQHVADRDGYMVRRNGVMTYPVRERAQATLRNQAALR